MHGLFHSEVQRLMDILAAIAHLQHLRFEAGAVALFANQFNIGEELHLHRDRAVALANLASATWDVEGKMSGSQASLIGFGLAGVEGPNGITEFDKGTSVCA